MDKDTVAKRSALAISADRRYGTAAVDGDAAEIARKIMR